MKIIALILLLTSSVAFAQNISRTELRNTNAAINTRISTNATAVNARNAAAEATNATQTAAITAANATNAAQTVAIALANDTNATQTAAIAAANATNATQTTDIAAANATNATQTAAIAGLGSLSTNNLPVLSVTNLLAQNLDVDVFNVGTLIVTNNRAQFADAANHQIDGNIAPEWDGTNSMAQGTRLAITNGTLMTNHQSFTIDVEGAASGGANYALTNTFPAGDLASLNGSALASSFTDTVTNGTAFEDSWRRTWKRGTNIWVGYRAWRAR